MKNNAIILVSVFGICSAIFSDEENAQLPRLFHLDDQERCLLQKDGVYCMGEFDLMPIGNSPTYELIKKYSSHIEAFNRSLLYRGYCLNKRCPQTQTNRSIEESLEQQFERCVQRNARPHALSARLRSLQYCSTHRQHQLKMSQGPDAEQQLFLQLVGAVLALNVAGTIYDLMTNDEKKTNLLQAWSIRDSWRRLTATQEHTDPRLKQLEPLQGIRVMSFTLTIYCHAWVVIYQFYVASPQNLEMIFKRFDGTILVNGMSLIQGFVLIANFLMAYGILIYSERKQLSLYMVPGLVFKRVIRILPVQLLFVGFAATYWPATRPGAASSIIGQMTQVCRKKFWTHVWFLNNIIDRANICIPPTWFLPVDMHLFILASVLTIIMSRRREKALRLYAALFVLSAIFCGVVAYITGLKIASAIVVSDTVRRLFVNAPASISEYYMSTWASLPACFLGLFFAHLQYELQQKNFDWNKLQWLKHLYPWLIPSSFVYIFTMGVVTRRWNDNIWVSSLCVALDRPIFTVLLFLNIFAVINIDGGQRRFFSWSGWRVPARLSLPIMLSHWIVAIIIAGRPLAYFVSAFDVMINYVGMLFFSYAVSVPVALLLEIPIRTFFSQILF